MACGSCSYFDKDELLNNYSTKGYCSYYNTYYYPEESGDCSHYSPISGSSGCFITTIIHDMLRINDDSKIMNILREFRNEILNKDKKYEDILYSYDKIGPMIAKSIKEDNDVVLCNILFNTYLVPISKLIKNKSYTNAIEKYKELTLKLMNYYNIDTDIIIDKNYDYEKGGHGKVFLKKNFSN